MEQYGTDAVRFTLAQLAVQGRDLILSRRSAGGVARVRQQDLERGALRDDEPRGRAAAAAAPVDREARAGRALDPERASTTRSAKSRAAIDAYEFNVAALSVYSSSGTSSVTGTSSWPRSRSRRAASGRPRARCVLVQCFDRMLRLLHPFMPFISEEIWQALRPYIDEPDLAPHLAIAKFPVPQTRTVLEPRRRRRDGATASRRPRRSTRCARCSAIIRASGSKRGSVSRRRRCGGGVPRGIRALETLCRDDGQNGEPGVGRAVGRHAGRDGLRCARVVRGRGDGARGIRLRPCAQRAAQRSSTK